MAAAFHRKDYGAAAAEAEAIFVIYGIVSFFCRSPRSTQPPHSTYRVPSCQHVPDFCPRFAFFGCCHFDLAFEGRFSSIGNVGVRSNDDCLFPLWNIRPHFTLRMQILCIRACIKAVGVRAAKALRYELEEFPLFEGFSH